jgi:polyhydroxyalkanoate synthesis regulator phasin
MDRKKVLQKLIEFQKGTFDNSFDALAKLQDQGENMVDTFLSQAPWLPEESRKAAADWMKAYKKARDDFKKTVDANYEKVADFFDSADTDV